MECLPLSLQAFSFLELSSEQANENQTGKNGKKWEGSLPARARKEPRPRPPRRRPPPRRFRR